ncbi:hypothetical protein, partial [Dialister invisus]|uniref:hypothetical protein n=1 Tax=Dialister invisus TaxID=218538 RepID=UPI00307896BE
RDVIRVIDSSLRVIFPLSRLSYKAFLSPFRMTIEGESVMMRGTIRRHNEGNVNRHPERM